MGWRGRLRDASRQGVCAFGIHSRTARQKRLTDVIQNFAFGRMGARGKMSVGFPNVRVLEKADIAEIDSKGDPPFGTCFRRECRLTRRFLRAAGRLDDALLRCRDGCFRAVSPSRIPGIQTPYSPQKRRKRRQNTWQNLHICRTMEAECGRFSATISALVRYIVPKSRHFYTTAQAGKLLGVTDDTIRRWAAEGRIEAETTPGGQMRISVDEIRRVKAEGKLLPRAAPSAPRLRHGSEAARLAEQLETERLRLKLERMQQQREEAERRARLEEQRRRQEQLEAERLAQEQEEAERRAREDYERRQAWLRRAARRFESLSAEARLAALEVFEKRLSAMNPLPEDGYLARLLDAVEEAARTPMRVEAENRRLLQRLLDEYRELAREARYSDLRDEALLRMHEAVRGLDLETPFAVREAAARRALEPVLARYRREKLREELGLQIEAALRRAGATSDELEQARREWQRRCAELIGADETALQAAAAELERSCLAQVEQRRQAEQEAERRQLNAVMETLQRADARMLARTVLSSIVPDVLRRMERDSELEFEGPWDFRDTALAVEARLLGPVTEMLLEGTSPHSDATRTRIARMAEQAVWEVAEGGEDAA